jgi:cytochrome oxidase Cu insertion factor (SCO1/SenC/PrrC family)
VRALPGAELREANGAVASANLFTEKWALAYVGNGACDETCRKALYFMRQTRLSLNNEMTRVARVFLATGECCDRAFLEREHPGLVVIDATGPEARDLVAAFPATEQPHSLFIVDPLGNLVMRYDTRDDPKGLLTDLKKLLKLSHIG